MAFLPRRILVATDFSGFSQEAADAADLLASTFQGALTLLHVIPATLYVAEHMSGLNFSPSDFKAEGQRRVQAKGEAERTRLRAGGARTTFVAIDGRIDTEVVRFAKEGLFDLLVVGSHGQTGLLRLVMGSVAEHVVRFSKVPVLVIHQSATTQASRSAA